MWPYKSTLNTENNLILDFANKKKTINLFKPTKKRSLSWSLNFFWIIIQIVRTNVDTSNVI